MIETQEHKSTIVVDGRVFSSDAHDRGMGRYVKFLMETIASLGFDICLILYKNSRLKKNDPLRSSCKKIEHIDIDPAVYNEQDIHQSSYAIETIIKNWQATAFIDATPFFFPMRLDITECPVIAVAYDLIPLRHPEKYFEATSVVVDLYHNGLRRLINADSVIAISNYSKKVVSDYLGIEKHLIGVIYPCLEKEYLRDPVTGHKSLDFFAILGGHFSKNPKFTLELSNQLNIPKKRAYKITVPTDSQLNALKTEFPLLTKQLVIHSSIEEWEKALNQAQAKVVFHLSRDEGFGIPLLEALFKHTRVVCSNIEINREILEKSENGNEKIALLVPTNEKECNVSEIAKFMDQPDTIENVRIFKKIKDYFIAHWTTEAPTVMKTLVEIASEKYKQFTKEIAAKMVCNMPSDFCGVADYAFSIPFGTQKNMLVYTADTSIKKMHGKKEVRLKSHLCFPKDQEIAVPTIFHLAVSQRLWFGIELLRIYGSTNDIVIVHDHIYLYGLYYFSFHYKKMTDFLNNYFVDSDSALRGKIHSIRYMNLDEFNNVTKGYSSAWLRRKQLKLISHLTQDSEKEHELFCNTTLLQDKKYVEIGINDRASPVLLRMREIWRAQKRLSKLDLLVGVFGSVTDNKYITEISSAVSKACKHMRTGANQDNLSIHFIICGVVHDRALFDHIVARFASLGLTDCFHYENPPSEEAFDAIMAATDIVISCRKQDRGQLSHIVPRALSLGRPMLTNSKSGYSMIRNDFIIDEEHFESNLLDKLCYFARNREDLKSISHFNRQLFLEKHNITHFFEKITTYN